MILALAAALAAQTPPPPEGGPREGFIVCPGHPRCPRAGQGANGRGLQARPRTGAVGSPPPLPQPAPPEEALSAGRIVYFAVNSAALDERARTILDGVVQWLHFNPPIRVTIEGHADSRGGRAHNLALAARRAEAVRDWLVHRGILASRLTTISYGEERPALYDSGEQVWMMNRRVEIRVR